MEKSVKKFKYSIGIDIGNASVGWAVINYDNFKVIRKGNKALWGVRLFDVATTAEDRRKYRGSRKRYDRRRRRIKLLQREFKKELDKKDINFITKLNESFYNEKDTKNKTIILTKEEKQNIKKYNKQYPTIYHLRKKLVDSSEKEDIRLVYLAIHHIIKYRGNFLYGTGKFSLESENIIDDLKNTFLEFEQLDSLETNIENIDYIKLNEAFYEKYKNDKKLKIEQALGQSLPKKTLKEIVKLLVGDKFSLNNMFNLEDEDIKISFKGSEYDDKYSEIEKKLQDKIEILECLKNIYDVIFLKQLFKGSNAKNLSSLMVERYNKHGDDLKKIKSLYRSNSQLFKKMFKTTKRKDCIYDSYIKNNMTYSEFVKKIENDLDLLSKNFDKNSIDLANNILNDIKSEEFLPRITSVDNGKYPFQLNREELIKIIENQGKYYPFLTEKLDDGKYKIVKLLEFKIPYYVGPLNDSTKDKNIKNPNSWLVKKDDKVVITPYNFDKIVDKEKTAQLFIERMIGNCTYLLNEKAIPTNSILYSKFKVLNELKQIRVGEKGYEERLTKELQQKIYNEFFLTDTKVTDKRFKEYLKNNKEFEMIDNLSVIGYSALNKFSCNMASYIDFFGENGFFKNTDYTIDDAEEIIKLITIFEDKDILKNCIERDYPNISSDNIKAIVRKKYKGWSNLSKKLLTGVYYKDKETSIAKSIMTLMEETSENFMQIMCNKKYKFDDKIKELNNQKELNKLDYSVVKDLATSPSIKRAIYQALKVIDEIVKYIGYNPEQITIEMARGDGKKERTVDRKKKIEKLYEKYKNEIDRYNELKSELSKYERIDSEKLFLYFIQEGKSLYSGTPLDISKLEQYEVDHIIPRTLIKDNSIDNKALVLKEENQEKGASFVLPKNFRTVQNKIWWQRLKKLELISTKKYNSLCRYKFDEEIIEGFINRQLVETRQICKHTANILSSFYKKTDIIYLNASLSHNYREKFDLFKFRELNDYHHAHDAYLAAVFGIYKTNFLKHKIEYSEIKELNKKLYLENKYKGFKDGYVINSLDSNLFDKLVNQKTGEIIYTDDFNKLIEDTLYRNDILISKKVEFKTGEFFNQTKQDKTKKGFKLKENLPVEYYGSYGSINRAYAVLVKSEHQPIVIVEQSKNNPKIIIEHIRELLNLDIDTHITILVDKIPFNSLLDYDGQICYLVGASDKIEVCNAVEFHIDKEHMKKWKYIFNEIYNKRADNKKETNEIYEQQLDDIIKYIFNKVEKEYKLYQNLTSDMKVMFIENLNNISIENKERIIREMLNLLKCNSVTANFKFLNDKYSKEFGRKKNITIKNCIIINKSVTGIWENKRIIG